MVRPLLIVAGAGIGISIVCLTLASMLSPFRDRSSYYDSTWWGSRPPWSGDIPFAESGEMITRDFSWTGADSAEINIPGVVYFESAPRWSVTAKGPKSSVEHLRIDHGAILFDAPLAYPHTSALEVRIKGPSLTHVGLNGTGKLILENVAQKEIAIDLRGSGSVQGRGRVERLELRIFGSGNAQLGELATNDVDASIFGSGNADVAPTGDVEVKIFGSGDVKLHAHPRNVSTTTFGSGRVIQLEPEQRATRDRSPDGPI